MKKQLSQTPQAKYYREWRLKNPGRAAEYSRRYWEKKNEQQKTEPGSGKEKANAAD